MNLKGAIHKSYFLAVLALVVLIGGTSVSSLVHPEKSLNLKQVTDRLPASLAPAVVVEPTKYTDVIEMDCVKNQFKSDALQVRLKGLLCNGLVTQDLAGTSVMNKATGDSIAIFKVGDSQVTTDFIHLEKGENHITLSQADHNYEIVIVR